MLHIYVFFSAVASILLHPHKLKGQLWKDIVHVDTVVSLAAVSLDVEFTKLLLLIRNDEVMLKLALVPLFRIRHTRSQSSNMRGPVH